MWSLYPFIARDIAVWVPEGTDQDPPLAVAFRVRRGVPVVLEPVNTLTVMADWSPVAVPAAPDRMRVVVLT